MSEELKACSYCGKQPQGNNWHTYGRNPKDEMRYFCANHDCPNGFHKVLTLEEWNTRPIEDALRASLAASQAEVERLRDRNADLEQYIKKAIGDISDTIDDLSHAKISLQIALKGGAQ